MADRSDARSVLLVTYAFPPMGGSGVQRMAKLARYLPEFGWEVDVVTVKDISYYSYDPTLLADLPGATRVHRAGSLDPLRVHRLIAGTRRDSAPVSPGASHVGLYRRLNRLLFVPDAQMLWIPFAVSRALRIAKANPPAVICSSAPMLSSHVAGLLLSRRLKLPFVADFRDPWTADPYLDLPSRAHLRIHRRLERKVLEEARWVVTISERIRQEFLESNPDLDADRFVVVPNGFDPADFDGVPARVRDGFEVKYVGSLHAHHRRPLSVFLDAMKSERRASGHPRIRLRVIGSVHDSLLDLLQQPELRADVELEGYLPHREAVAEAKGAGALLLLVDFAPGNETTVTGKVFDYLGARRPIVLVGPKGDAAQLIRDSGAGAAFGASDELRLSEHLSQLAQGTDEPVPAELEAFSRRRHAERFAHLFAATAAVGRA